MPDTHTVPIGLLLLTLVAPHAPATETNGGADGTAAAAVVTTFHDALLKQDRTLALAQLAADVTVLENGYLETATEYAAHHLQMDMAFAASTRPRHEIVRVQVNGNSAWIAASNRVRGQFQGRAVNSIGAELVILKREQGRWRIQAIHWSSRKKQP